VEKTVVRGGLKPSLHVTFCVDSRFEFQVGLGNKISFLSGKFQRILKSDVWDVATMPWNFDMPYCSSKKAGHTLG